MMNTPTAEITLTQRLDATPEAAFQAWTDPARLSQWFGPHGFTAPQETVSLDLRPGGAWSVVLVNGETRAPLGGVYREIDGPTRLSFTTGDPDNAEGTPASVATLTFTAAGDGTEMRFHQAGYHTPQEHADAAKAGWVQFFERLAAYLAGR